jgi:hypothetical protein
MRTSLSVATTVAALLLGPNAALSQTPDQLVVMKRLGPDGFASAPHLDVLVDASAAAIVGRVVGNDGFALRDVDSPYSDRRGAFGYVSYRIAVDDVLFVRKATGVPRLAAGTVVALEQRVHGDGALRFFRRQFPVAAGDTCLLFLEAEPRGVTLSGWTVHFRRTAGPTTTAETLGPESLATAMGTTPGWFGPAVRMVTGPHGAVPEWESLLGEVRRLGTLDASAVRRR